MSSSNFDGGILSRNIILGAQDAQRNEQDGLGGGKVCTEQKKQDN